MKRPGIKDVAHHAGVSTSTVSLVLTSQPKARISAATRERVRAAASELGYVPNSVARSLRTKRTKTIGLISDQIATTPFAVRMVEAAQNVARDQGHLIFLVNTGSDGAAQRQAVDALVNQHVDGFIFACMWHQVVEPPANLPAGTVFLDARPAGGGFPAVVPDDHGGAKAAVQELVRHGHRRIAYLGSGEPPVPIASGLRRAGYLQALQAAGIEANPDLQVDVPLTTAAGGVEAAGALLDLPEQRRPTAIFCFNDRIAMGAYRAARHRGLEIPRDLSVVGYDDQQFIAEALDPPLTTVALPHYEMGHWAMEVMLGLRAPPTGDGVAQMPCPLVRRDSVSPPPATLRRPTSDGD